MYEKYALSGKVPLAGAGMLICWTPLATIGLSAIYAVAQRYVPFIVISALMTILFPMAAGISTGWLARRGAIRNAAFTAVVAFVSALAGYYVMWGVHFLVSAELPPGASAMDAFHPRVILSYMEWGYQNGFWGIGRAKQNISGMFLAGIWVVEFAIMVIGPPVVAAGFLSSEVFCETCQHWVPWQPLRRTFAVGETDELKNRLKSGEWRALETAPAPEDAANGQFYRAKLACCSGCEELAVLHIEEVTVTTNKKGEKEEKASGIVKNAMLDFEEAVHIQTL